MLFTVKKNTLVLTIDHDGERKSLQDFLDAGEIESDSSMYEFFEEILYQRVWEWIPPEDIGALTSAPILGRRIVGGEVMEAYGFMDYAVTSMLKELYDFGTVTMHSG